MRARFSFAAGAWAAATAAATLISWFGVQIVTSAVTPAPAAVLPARSIAAAVTAAPPDDVGVVTLPTPTTTTAVPAAHQGSSTTSATTVRPPVTATSPMSSAPTSSPTTATGRSSPSTSTSPAATGGVLTPASSTTTSVGPGSDPVAPVSIPSPQTVAHTATYQASGGEVTVTCSGPAVSMVNASPANGYQLWVVSDGPDQVQVVFIGGQARSAILAVCASGLPVGRTLAQSSTASTSSVPSGSASSGSADGHHRFSRSPGSADSAPSR